MNNQKKWVRIMAIVLAGLMVLGLIVGAILSMVPNAFGVTQSEIEALKAEAATLKTQKESLENELFDLEDKKDTAVAQKRNYDDQIHTLAEEIRVSESLIQSLDDDIAAAEVALGEAVAQEQEGKALFEQRLAAMQQMGEPSYLGVLIDADSFSDFLTRWEGLSKIITHDNDLAEVYRAHHAAVEAEEARLEQDRADGLAARADLSAAEEEAAVLSAKADRLVAETMGEIAEQEEAIEDKEAAEKAKLEQIEDLEEQLRQEIAEAARKAREEAERRRQEELQRQKEEEERRRREAEANGETYNATPKPIPPANEYVGGEFAWPLPGYTNISSPFGWRIHPVYHTERLHTGADIPAPNGTPVHAANSGTVILRTYNGAYGNCVVVDHGGGKNTLYGHLSGYADISVGQHVDKGTTIAYVGSTGLSTGNHLHFEVIIDGEQVNPIPYVSG